MKPHLFSTEHDRAARERFSILERIRSMVVAAQAGAPLIDDLTTPPRVILIGITSISDETTFGDRLYGIPVLGYATEEGDRLLQGAYDHVKLEREESRPLLGEDDPENVDLRLLGVALIHGADNFGVRIQTPDGELITTEPTWP